MTMNDNGKHEYKLAQAYQILGALLMGDDSPYSEEDTVKVLDYFCDSGLYDEDFKVVALDTKEAPYITGDEIHNKMKLEFITQYVLNVATTENAGIIGSVGDAVCAWRNIMEVTK